jgi:hypothetical protein
MRSSAVRFVLVGFVSCFALAWYPRNQSVAVQQRAPVPVTRLYTGGDGLSHVEQAAVKFSPAAVASVSREQSEPIKDTSSYVVRLAPGFFEDWHNADKRRYIIPVSGKSEIEVSGGQKISIEPGRIYLAEDLTGKGHTFRVVGGDDWVALFVDFDSNRNDADD